MMQHNLTHSPALLIIYGSDIMRGEFAERTSVPTFDVGVAESVVTICGAYDPVAITRMYYNAKGARNDLFGYDLDYALTLPTNLESDACGGFIKTSRDAAFRWVIPPMIHHEASYPSLLEAVTGDVVSIVGMSGCGKTVAAWALIEREKSRNPELTVYFVQGAPARYGQRRDALVTYVAGLEGLQAVLERLSDDEARRTMIVCDDLTPLMGYRDEEKDPWIDFLNSAVQRLRQVGGTQKIRLITTSQDIAGTMPCDGDRVVFLRSLSSQGRLIADPHHRHDLRSILATDDGRYVLVNHDSDSVIALVPQIA